VGISMTLPRPVKSTESTSTKSSSLRPSVLFKPAKRATSARARSPPHAGSPGRARAPVTSTSCVHPASTPTSVSQKNTVRSWMFRRKVLYRHTPARARASAPRRASVFSGSAGAGQGRTEQLRKGLGLTLAYPYPNAGRTEQLRKAVQQGYHADELGRELQRVCVKVKPAPARHHA